jgi:hypothetical protein
MLTASMMMDLTSMTDSGHIRYPSVTKRVVIIVGGFGSGKTEVAVNLVKYLATIEKTPPAIADLDLVNPYFRSREAITEMEELGIKVIVPRGGHYYADLPILLPEVRGAIEESRSKVILDVGGDAQGTRALGSMSDAFQPGDYDMWMVLNSRRPSTSDMAVSIKTMSRIETTARLKFTGLIANSHMIDDTDEEVLLEGYRLGQDVSRETGLPLVFISAKRRVLEQMDTGIFECPVFPLTRSMLKPWERKETDPEDTQSRK